MHMTDIVKKFMVVKKMMVEKDIETDPSQLLADKF